MSTNMNDISPKNWLTTAVLLACFLFTGCMSAIGPDGYSNDPLEPMNRKVYAFNGVVDKILFKPVSQAYDFVFPKPVKKGVTNFFGNLGDIVSLVNAIIQLDGDATAGIAARVINNTFFGLGGLIDVATPMGNPKIKKNFGSTLDHYGVGSGPYLVLPLLGPSTLRDALALVPDIYLNPITYVNEDSVQWSSVVLYGVNTRASLFPLEEQLNSMTTDPYATTRDVWLQHRWSELGHPVDNQDDDYDDLFATPEAEPSY